MSQLQQNRYDQLLRRVGDLKGGGSKVNDVLSELFPMFDVENLPLELYKLAGWNIAIGAHSVSPVAAETSRIQVFNPAASGKIAVVTQISARSPTAQRLRYATTFTALLTGIGTETFRDIRHPVAARPTVQVRSDTTVAATDANGMAHIEVNIELVIAAEKGLFVLPPGTGAEIGTNDVNTGLTATFYWRERVAEPSELSF